MPNIQNVSKKKLSPLTIEKLQIVRDRILKNPKGYNQREGRIPDCETPGCILGHVAYLFGQNITRGSCGPRVRESAAKALDFVSKEPFDAGCRLIYGLWEIAYWPTEFFEQYYNARTDAGRARAAAARINYFIKTDGE